MRLEKGSQRVASEYVCALISFSMALRRNLFWERKFNGCILCNATGIFLWTAFTLLLRKFCRFNLFTPFSSDVTFQITHFKVMVSSCWTNVHRDPRRTIPCLNVVTYHIITQFLPHLKKRCPLFIWVSFSFSLFSQPLQRNPWTRKHGTRWVRCLNTNLQKT